MGTRDGSEEEEAEACTSPTVYERPAPWARVLSMDGPPQCLRAAS